jgi:hypothetical protein
MVDGASAMSRFSLCLAGLMSLLVVSDALAQQPPGVRIRGTIEAANGSTLDVKSRDGTMLKVNLTDNVVVIGVVKIAIADIKPNSYIGVTAMPQPDGSQRAIAVHIFPEAQRGTGEGFMPWDLRPNSTMTNATVAETVAGTDGQNILVKYKDGEKKVVVPPDTPVVTFAPADKSELKPGAKILIFRAVRKDDGTLEANRVNVGRDGLMPPM